MDKENIISRPAYQAKPNIIFQCLELFEQQLSNGRTIARLDVNVGKKIVSTTCTIRNNKLILLERLERGLDMKEMATTKMSSKGQVVIPEAIRNRLGLQAGSQFIVLGEDDVVIMKTINKPSMRDFDSLIEKARKQARLTGLKQSDIEDAIVVARSKA